MDYCCLNVVEIEEESTEGFTNPNIDGEGHFVNEVWDKGLSHIAETMHVGLVVAAGNESETLINIEDKMALDMIVSSSRILFWSNQFDKGNRYYSGLSVTGWAIAGIANAASMASAKKRSKGKVLVGHIRYEWLFDITYIKQGVLALPQIILTYTDDDGYVWYLHFAFKKGIDSESVARFIAQKAAWYKLKMHIDMPSESERVLYEISRGNIAAEVEPAYKNAMLISFPSGTILPAPLGEESRPLPEELGA